MRQWDEQSASAHSCLKGGMRVLFASLLLVLFSQQIAYAQSISESGAVNACGLDYSSDCRLIPFEAERTNSATSNDVTGIEVTGRVFSATVCQVETIITEVYVDMWCSVSDAIREPLGALILLYVVIFGVMIAAGLVQMNTKEIATRLLKLALVWVFATTAAFGITIMYQFYIAVLQEGIQLVLDVPASNLTGVDNVMQRLDIVANQVFASNQMNAEGRALTAIAGAFMVGSGVPGGPIVGSAMFSMAVMTFLVFARTVLTYLIAVIGLAFYLSLAPIFISLALFKVTNTMFERWLSQVTSFALQPVIIFAYLMMAEAYIDNFIDVVDMSTMEDVMARLSTVQETAFAGALTKNQEVFVLMDDPDCLKRADGCTYTDPDTDWTEGLGEFMELLSGMTAMLLLNFATLKFLDLVPEVARQISSGSARAIKIGGGLMGEGSFRPSGAELRAPTDGALDRLFNTVEHSNNPNMTGRWGEGFKAMGTHFRNDSIRRGLPE